MNYLCKTTMALLILSFCTNVFSQEPESTAREEELSFKNKDAVYFGTLSLPIEKGVYPVVILLSGTGPQDRDWSFNRGTYKMAKKIAEHLNKKGIAVYRFDDRGFGKSTGTAESETSFADLAEDIVVAVKAGKGHSYLSSWRIAKHIKT